MYPYTAPGSGTPSSVNTCYDSSPQFAEKPKSIICMGYDYTFSHNAYEPDFDSVYYSWVAPYGYSSGPVALAYTGGYSITNPFPNNGNPVGFTPTSGLVTINPDVSGSFMSCIKVESYRCNQKISEIYRDVALVIKSGCEATGTGSTNLPPELLLDSIPGSSNQIVVPVKTYSGYGTDTVYQADVYPGDVVKFRLTATDNQLSPSFNFQNVNFNANSAQIFNSSILNSCANPPCAYVSPVSPATSFTNSLSLQVDFEWEIACNHLSQINSCGIGSSKYIFPLKMQDDACPAPAISVATLVINVLPSVPSEPVVHNSCISWNEDLGAVQLDWGTPVDTGQDFKGYIVFHGNSSGNPFVAIDTVWGDYLNTTYSHTSTNPRPNNFLWRAPFTSGGNYYYFRTIGSCDYESENSDTIRLMELAVTPIPPTNSSVAQLDWNAPYTGATPTYEIWRRPQGTGAAGWAQVATTTNKTFNDTVNICGQDLEYQIRINGACNSTIDGGFFSDQNNTDVLKIDSVTVNGGTALISWTPGTNGDIVNYDILEWVPGTGWNSIATVPNTVSMPYPLPGATPGSSVKRYKVMSTDSCGNQSSDLLVAAHNNMLLTENMDPCEGIMRLRWNQYRGWAGGVKEYRVLADVTPPGGPTQPGVLLATKAPGDTAFNTRDLIGGWSYCYYIKAVDTAGQRFSSSNEVCINSLAVQRSRLLYLAKTSVRNDNAVELVTFIDKDADIIHFDLQRADRDGAPFTSLGLIPKPVSPPWEIRFKDFSADPNNHRYQYRFVATDSCGGIDTASNIGTNILLEVQPVDNLTNILTWNPYQEFMGGVLKYDIYRSVGENGGMSFVGTTTDTIFTDNIRPLGDNVGIFCYKVVATEGPSPLMFTDYDGSVFTSTSNVACGGEHKARVFIPNSFNPNSNVLENRTWKPKHVYVEDASYSLDIYDRWGVKVFSTRDVNKGWDGTIDGTKAAEGSYIYQLNYRSKQGEPVDLRGTLLLIY